MAGSSLRIVLAVPIVVGAGAIFAEGAVCLVFQGGSFITKAADEDAPLGAGVFRPLPFVSMTLPSTSAAVDGREVVTLDATSAAIARV